MVDDLKFDSLSYNMSFMTPTSSPSEEVTSYLLSLCMIGHPLCLVHLYKEQHNNTHTRVRFMTQTSSSVTPILLNRTQQELSTLVTLRMRTRLLLFCSRLLRFLDEVQSHSNENKMNVQNLATVFGPNILRPRVEDPVTMMEGR